MTNYHTGRSVHWGHWGITLMEPQPDTAKNFGVIVGTVPFAVGAQGPVDGVIGSPTRQLYRAMCDEWVRNGTRPACLVATL